MGRCLFPLPLLSFAIPILCLCLAKAAYADTEMGQCTLLPDEGETCVTGEGYGGKRYYYDTKLEKCKQFHFYGCEGNSNNFDSKELCIEKCMSGGSTDTDEELFSPTTTASAIKISSNASSDYCVDQRSADAMVSVALNRLMTPLLEASERLGGLCAQGEETEGDGEALQLRTYLNQLNSTLTASTAFAPPFTPLLFALAVPAKDCSACTTGAKGLRAYVSGVKSTAEGLVLSACAKSNDTDERQRCTTFADDFLAPVVEFVKDFLDDELLCKIVSKPCVLPGDEREYKYKLHDSTESPGAKVFSCDLCESLLARADKQIPRLTTAINSIGTMVCSHQRGEKKAECQTNLLMASSLASAISTQISAATRSWTCQNTLHCRRRDQVSNPTRCYDGSENNWSECSKLKCKVRLNDAAALSNVINCTPGQGKINGNSCRDDSGQEVACSLLQCIPKSESDLVFSCATPPPPSCFADNVKNFPNVNTLTWRTCLRLKCWHSPTLSATCLDVHGQIETGACKTRADQQDTTKCTDGMFCVQTFDGTTEQGFYCKAN